MMRSRLFMWLFILFTLSILAACGSDDETVIDGDDVTDGDSEVTDGDQAEDVQVNPFRIVLISDSHTRLEGNPDDGPYDPVSNQNNLKAAVDRINDEFSDSAFVAVTGDLVGCLFSENADDYGNGVAPDNPADTFKYIMDDLSIPYYVAIGNHDYQKDFDADAHEGINTDNLEAIESVWEKVLDIDPYYSFVHEGVRMIFLNSNRGDARTAVCTGNQAESFCTGSFDDAQLSWFEDELDQAEPVLIFMHHPPITDSEDSLFSFLPTFLIEEDDPFYDLVENVKDKVLGIFVGHGHIWEHDTMFGSIPVYETSSIGDTNGHPDNIHLIDVDGNQPSIEVTIARDGAEYWSEMGEAKRMELRKLYKF